MIIFESIFVCRGISRTFNECEIEEDAAAEQNVESRTIDQHRSDIIAPLDPTVPF